MVPQIREATPTEAPTVTSSSETVATPPQRLKPLGILGQEFANVGTSFSVDERSIGTNLQKHKKLENKLGFTLEERMKFHGVTGLRQQPLI